MSDLFIGYLILSSCIAGVHSICYATRIIICEKTITTRFDVLFFILFPLTLIMIMFIFLMVYLLENIKKSKIIEWLQEPLRKE
ncbi:hypothetical protein FC831_10460 [Clostridium botulinum]|nr:hypothetical protein [Clostridium botulinum]